MIWSSNYTKIALAITGLGIGALAISGYVHERERAVRAETIAETQAQVQKGLTSQIADLQKQMADRDAAYVQQLQQLDKRFQAAATPIQVAALVSQLLALPKPITMVTPQPTPENPHPTPVAQVPLEDAPQVKAYVQACEECKLQLPKLQADLADRAAQQAAAQKQIDSLKQEKDSWKIAAKGGTVWQRTKKAAKFLLIGGAIGYIAARH